MLTISSGKARSVGRYSQSFKSILSGNASSVLLIFFATLLSSGFSRLDSDSGRVVFGADSLATDATDWGTLVGTRFFTMGILLFIDSCLHLKGDPNLQVVEEDKIASSACLLTVRDGV